MSSATLTPARRPDRPTAGPPRHQRPAIARTRGPIRRLWRGPVDEPPWARPALLALLAGTALLYLWNLSASGYANDYYAAPCRPAPGR